jgi:prephenate dehydrogenase
MRGQQYQALANRNGVEHDEAVGWVQKLLHLINKSWLRAATSECNFHRMTSAYAGFDGSYSDVVVEGTVSPIGRSRLLAPA